jgi:hypothetical protein
MISILTTVKDGYEFLEECAKSIFLQHCHYAHISLEWEWWIGINGHGDGGAGAFAAAPPVGEFHDDAALLKHGGVA